MFPHLLTGLHFCPRLFHDAFSLLVLPSRAKVLLSKGADINLMDSWGLAAVHWAACSNKPRALQALLT